MKSIIATNKLQAGRQVAETCVHFGFCTSVCPTYVLDGDENDSPRGRIALIKEMLKKGGKPSPKTVIHLDRCLSCLSCTTTCAAGVDYRTLIDTAREYIEASGVRPWHERWMRRLLASVLTTPWLLRTLLTASRPLSSVSARLPGVPGALGRLGAAAGAKALARRGEQIEPVVLDSKKATRRVALLEGCAQSVIGTEISDAAKRVLRRLGVVVVDCGTGNACCGAMKQHLGYPGQAARQAARLVDGWGARLASGDIEAIVVTTSGCGSVIRHYQEMFQEDPSRRELGERVASACIDISQFLLEIELPQSSSHQGARVAYHDTCSLKHGQGITRQPRQLLKKAGFKVLDIAESQLCCGSAGTFNILQPDIARRLGQRKAEHIAGVEPDVYTAANMGCLIQISMYIDKPGAHIVQLIDWATGGPPPRGLESYVPRAKEREMPSIVSALLYENSPATAEKSDLLW